MEMVEKIAIGQCEFDGRPWLSMPRTERDRYMARARLAIEAMREPTEAMLAAAHGSRWRLDTKMGTDAAMSLHSAMIDAALGGA
jgi:acyl-CoA reductase-like NAD-dependent aldehyde dehydrogenase